MEVYSELDKQQLRDRTTNTVANNDETDDYLTFNADTSKGEYDDIMNTVKSEWYRDKKRWMNQYQLKDVAI